MILVQLHSTRAATMILNQGTRDLAQLRQARLVGVGGGGELHCPVP